MKLLISQMPNVTTQHNSKPRPWRTVTVLTSWLSGWRPLILYVVIPHF